MGKTFDLLVDLKLTSKATRSVFRSVQETLKIWLYGRTRYRISYILMTFTLAMMNMHQFNLIQPDHIDEVFRCCKKDRESYAVLYR